MARARSRIDLDRRRLLTGAGSAIAAIGLERGWAQDAAPTPVPIRIQTPDLAFVDALQNQLAQYQRTGQGEDLLLSIVPAEPASDSLLADLRTDGRRFSGAFVPNWLIPDLVRDELIAPAAPPMNRLPKSIAQLRSFGGQWVATDFDHDCALLYTRLDLTSNLDSSSPESWQELIELLDETGLRIAIPQTHAQQVAQHFCALAASYVGDAPFWFVADTMEPAIASEAHQRALDNWVALTGHAVPAASTGELWQAFADGEATFLIATSDAFPWLMSRSIDLDAIDISGLPGFRLDDELIRQAGNTVGANWGGVSIRGLDDDRVVASFLNELAGSEAQTALWTDVTSGVVPAAFNVSADLGEATAAGWPTNQTERWLTAIHQTLNQPVQLPALRIAETSRYLQTLELRIIDRLDGSIANSSEALRLAAEDWRTINQAIDVSVQQDLFVRSMTPPPVE